VRLGRKRKVKPSLVRLKRLYERHGLDVLYSIGPKGKPGLTLIVEWEEREGLFFKLTEIGGELLMQVYKEHPGFVIRREFLNAFKTKTIYHLVKQ
jgi:hypothetical protein